LIDRGMARRIQAGEPAQADEAFEKGNGIDAMWF
jgi:hypothetical protein